MARERLSYYLYKNATGVQQVRETFTHKQVLPDGRVLRADPPRNFWKEEYPRGGNSSWYGVPPQGWDPRLAVLEPHVEEYETELDCS